MEKRLEKATTDDVESLRGASPLLASAYDFVEHSLEQAAEAATEPRRWKFAIIAIATSVELILKERLRREHPALIYTKVDDGSGHTVSVESALKRLRVCKVNIDQSDVDRLQRAKAMRNAIIHFGTPATSEQLRAAYVDLFEFTHSFHLRELGAELHDELGEDYWEAEAAFMDQFRREYVQYHGEQVHREWPAALVDAQFYTHWIIDGIPYLRIPYGDVREGATEPNDRPCHDCAALPRQVHGPDCDCERCPRCGGQTLLGCCGEVREWGSWPDGPREAATADAPLEAAEPE